MTLAPSSTKGVSDAKLDIKRTKVWRVWKNVRTRICAKPTMFLLVTRKLEINHSKIAFCLGESIIFRNEKERFEIDAFRNPKSGGFSRPP